MSAPDWSNEENAAIVASYFSMLSDELSGRPYVKAAVNRMVQQQTGRSRGSIEFKFQNISAICRSFALPFVRGYKPLPNFQMTLAEAVARYLAQNPEWEAALAHPRLTELADAPSLYIEPAPTLCELPEREEVEEAQRVARRFDVAGRDERNRLLGQAGEEFVYDYERRALDAVGRDDLARRVRWVSKEEGDGLGYDILSFTPEGQERLLEVKTTRGWKHTPFYISQNELDVANERQGDWRLFRLYEFGDQPKAFQLSAPLEDSVRLTATAYRASF